MMQTLKVKVETAPEQAKALLDTMHQFNAACN
jgi:predicted transposase